MHVVGLWEEVSGENTTQAQREHVNSTQAGWGFPSIPALECLNIAVHIVSGQGLQDS